MSHSDIKKRNSYQQMAGAVSVLMSMATPEVIKCYGGGL